MNRLHRFLNYLSVAVLCLVLCACGMPTPQATETPLPTPTPELTPSPTIDWFPATPTPTVEPKPEDPIVETSESPSKGDLILSDQFDDETLWETQKGTEAKISFEPNALSLALSGNQVEASSLSQHQLPSEFYLEITVEISLCSDKDQYGLILWRNSSSGTFRLWANCKGQLMVDRILPEGTSTLVKWQAARKLAPGYPFSNTFGVLAKEGTLDFYVNDVYQFNIQTRGDLEGPLGVIARSSGSHAMTVRFSDLKISKPLS